jgi:8-oxo-dGTP pyrophosphatase MutT (NUDIX family)
VRPNAAQSGAAQPNAPPPVAARPAATLVLVRPPPAGGPGLEVLMLERSSRADFAPGLFVFPGGGVDAEDEGVAAEKAAAGLTPEAAGRALSDSPSPRHALAHYVTAIRETFEEAGILLARSADGSSVEVPESTLAEGRRASAPDGTGFLDWLARAGLRAAAEDLIYFAHWITPKAAPKRYDTRFFLAEAPAGARVHTDQAEIVAYRWAAPDEALAAHAAGRMPMIEPTFHNIRALQGFASPAQARDALAGRTVRAVRPQFVTLPDGQRKILLPWDPGFLPDGEPT